MTSYEFNSNEIKCNNLKNIKNNVIKKGFPDIYEKKDLYSKCSNEELIIIYQMGDTEALDYLIKTNSRLIYSRVDKYAGTYMQDLSYEDLFQEGCIGLIKAANKFNYKLGFKFFTYAVHWIDQAIFRKIQNEGFTIRIPIHVFEDINVLRRVMNDLSIDNVNSLENLELIKNRTGFSEKEIYNFDYIYNNILNTYSLNNYVFVEEYSNIIEIIDIVKDNDETSVFDKVSENILKHDINKALDVLTERERDIIINRYGIFGHRELTLGEIGEKYNLTKERIRQIENIALDKLRKKCKSFSLKDYLYKF